MTAPHRRTIRWKQSAHHDLAAIANNIAADNPQAADRFVDDILARIETLAQFPFSAGRSPHHPKARQLVFGNYLVYYTVGRREVVLRAIVHGARLFRTSWLRRK